MPLPKVRLSPVLEGLPLLPCCLSEVAVDARSHFPLTLVPSPPLTSPSSPPYVCLVVRGQCALPCFH